MGLAASQARLLSITARLSQNELHSQQIANSKVRLADKTQEASKEYISALSATKLMYTTYDAKGNATQVNFSPAVMYQFGELKNQYGISNTNGQLLVGATDANNFASSASMVEFIQKYGVQLTDNPEFESGLKMIYGEDYTDFYDMTNYASTADFGGVDILNWAIKPENTWTEATYNTWLASKDQINVTNKEAGDYGKLINALTNPPPYPGPEPIEPKKEDYAILKDFADTVKSHPCYELTYDYKCNCFMHVLSDMLGVGEHKTSSGETFNVVDTGSWNWNYAGHTEDDLPGINAVKDVIRKIDSVTEPDKTIYQRIVDFLWNAKDDYNMSDSYGGQYTLKQENLDIFESIIYDLENGTSEDYDIDHANWEAEKARWDAAWAAIQAWGGSISTLNTEYEDALANLPDPKIPDPEDSRTEWYTNLWHRMNGESNFKSKDGTSGKYYKELDSNLFNSNDWLKFALEQGVVTLEQVVFVENAELETGLKNSKWQSTIYSSAADIAIVEDEVAVARAEAEYTKKMNEIEAKDKKYDLDIKKLDTEHSALQTEYDSIQAVIQKNTDRSFKAFS